MKYNMVSAVRRNLKYSSTATRKHNIRGAD